MLSSTLSNIQQELNLLTAIDAAELFLSPHINSQLLNEATAESGPSLWIVNRSDVYDQTLTTLSNHSIASIATRAKEKLAQRQATFTAITPPELDTPIEEIPDHSVEDLLGHPLCPFEAMIFFSRSLNEDHRASSALSLTRRTLEFPPKWYLNPVAKSTLIDVFGKLLRHDSSAFVRSYCARIPFLPASILEDCLAIETNPKVRSRLLQNPQTSLAMLERSEENPLVSRVQALDQRLKPDMRKNSTDLLTQYFHNWYLKN